MKKTFLFFATISLSLFLTNCGKNKPTATIELISTSDLRGHALTPSEDHIGYTQITNYVEFLEENDSPVLLVDAGNYLQGSAVTNLNKGARVIEAMNIAGYDVAGIGHHEFDFGSAQLLALNKKASFDLVSANTRRNKGKDFPFISYHSTTIKDVRVAVVGITTPETAWKTAASNIIGWEFWDPIESLEPLIKQIKPNHDVIILLAHLDDEEKVTTTDIAKSIPEINVIIGGSEEVFQPRGRTVGKTFIINSGNDAQSLAHTSIHIENGVITRINGKVLHMTAEELHADYTLRPRAQKVHDLLQRIALETNDMLNQVILTIGHDLDGSRNAVRRGETNLGRLIADAFRVESGAQLAIMNGGGIRSSIPSGDVTFGNILDVLPFEDTLFSVKITGSNLKEALEHSLQLYPEENGAFLHISGFTYTFNPNAAVGERVKEIYINDQPINLDAEYSLALLGFLASGGDGFDMLKLPILGEYSNDADILIQYIKEHGKQMLADIEVPRIFVIS
ncbi:bifunctional UDP-sugar hydrolase/5'-nucleotidase [Entomospira entomophila]|uniref:Bifunctional metallophosphatase/5'-nucleotidase n=1 Tax=Entomospira entomophila TaxID=2719988 RepID=A0A968G7X9_9SPIO|nr:bifunctional UDP-sugar hydrolase/5'-nucleotidase [Entomospira entomophilus]NIZ40218.1 bifunctional metallophosphatase/5'-nucleotidase [Entomospira entomophilus]WDI35777.1 bifunctional UDP-sugar hydrolase/5'-nucleotidase [Entomospira entomophilus]